MSYNLCSRLRENSTGLNTQSLLGIYVVSIYIFSYICTWFDGNIIDCLIKPTSALFFAGKEYLDLSCNGPKCGTFFFCLRETAT